MWKWFHFIWFFSIIFLCSYIPQRGKIITLVIGFLWLRVRQKCEGVHPQDQGSLLPINWGPWARKVHWMLPPGCPSHRASQRHYNLHLSTHCSYFMRPWGSESPAACPTRPKCPRIALFQNRCYGQLTRPARDEGEPPPATQQNCQLNQRHQIGSSGCLWLIWT